MFSHAPNIPVTMPGYNSAQIATCADEFTVLLLTHDDDDGHLDETPRRQLGLRIPGPVAPTPGSAVTARRANGTTSTETIGRVVWQGADASLCTVGAAAQQVARATRRPRYRMGSGAGSAAHVAGYSSYCTDRPGCGCYDCAS